MVFMAEECDGIYKSLQPARPSRFANYEQHPLTSKEVDAWMPFFYSTLFHHHSCTQKTLAETVVFLPLTTHCQRSHSRDVFLVFGMFLRTTVRMARWLHGPGSLVVTLLPYSRCLSFSNLPHIISLLSAMPFHQESPWREWVLFKARYTRGVLNAE